MEMIIKKKQESNRKSEAVISQFAAAHMENPFEELQRYLRQPRLKRADCPNPITWWGVSNCFILAYVSLNLVS
jgi:hypothetical protein